MKLFKIFSERKSKTILFIFGCQRSGTTMLTDLLEKCPEFSVYGEGNKKVMMLDNYRIKDEKIIKKLVLRDKKNILYLNPSMIHRMQTISLMPTPIPRRYGSIESILIQSIQQLKNGTVRRNK